MGTVKSPSLFWTEQERQDYLLTLVDTAKAYDRLHTNTCKYLARAYDLHLW